MGAPTKPQPPRSHNPGDSHSLRSLRQIENLRDGAVCKTQAAIMKDVHKGWPLLERPPHGATLPSTTVESNKRPPTVNPGRPPYPNRGTHVTKKHTM